MKTEGLFPWASQGDIFRDVPLPMLRVVDGKLNLHDANFGPALLVTHGCVMDKRAGASNRLKVDNLQWLPLRDLGLEDINRQTIARGREVQPYGLFYVGSLAALGYEAYGLLSELISVPAEMMEPSSVDYTGVTGADDGDPHHATFGRHGERLASLEQTELALLHVKMLAFWTGSRPE